MGILQRYVIGEVGRSFGLALLTMTAIFVLFMVAAQARDIGLSPGDIAHLVPYVIPSTLPYTIPVSLLFAATVVYGRLAGDNEIIAVKSAGLSVWTVLWPTIFLGMGLSILLLYASSGLDSTQHSQRENGSLQRSGGYVLQAAGARPRIQPSQVAVSRSRYETYRARR